MWPRPLEADVGPFEILHVHQVPTLGLKSEVTLKVYFKQTVAMAIMKVYFRRAKCNHGHSIIIAWATVEVLAPKKSSTF